MLGNHELSVQDLCPLSNGTNCPRTDATDPSCRFCDVLDEGEGEIC